MAIVLFGCQLSHELHGYGGIREALELTMKYGHFIYSSRDFEEAEKLTELTTRWCHTFIVVEKAQVTVFNRLRMLLLEVGWSPARDSVDSKSLDCESPLSVALRMPPLFLVAVQRLGLRYRAGEFMDALFLRTRTTYKWTTWMQVQTCCMNYLGDMLVSPYIHTCSHQTPHKQHNTQGRTKIKR